MQRVVEWHMERELHQANRLSWNEATVAHNSHKGDQARFFREGGNKLFAEERELLGDLHGLSVVHLQCNAGQDTLSLAQLGATVTGVDISDVAVDFARNLSAESGVAATFHRSDVYDWLEETERSGERFDIAFSSYGALCWLSDINLWARGVAAILKPGGRLVVMEFHPVSGMYDEAMNRIYPYSGQGQAWSDGIGVGDYVAATGSTATGFEEGIQDFENPHPAHEWMWGIGEVAAAVLGAGLSIETLREYLHCNGLKMFDCMREITGRRWVLPDDVPNMPLMYGIAARREG